MDDIFLKPYEPKDTESRIYSMWKDSGFFNPDTCIEKGITPADAEPFSIVLPPPNITGRLHLGHAMEHGLQDAVIRFQRMRGKKTLWIPGTDSAAIATQARFEKESKLRRHDFSRQEFFDKIHEFGLKNQKDMQQQMQLFGSSLDWSREAFTLDEKRNLAVRTAFKRMYDEGLIYRGYRIVNWDPKGQTTISDDEILHQPQTASLYTFKYWKDFPISISTTRPETKVGDVAVAVHPEDSRYTQYINQTYSGNFCGVELSIKIVGDTSVDKDFGTGALGVTPAHSQIDWEIAERHNLEKKPVINEYAKMTVGDERILNKKTTEAREIIVEYLRFEELLEKEEVIDQNISTAERTGGIVEPLPKLQWFINVNKPIKSHNNHTLKDLMSIPVQNGDVSIMPDRFKKVYQNWIENLRDWCISRQIIYGHQVPVWYKGDEIYCDITPPSDEGWTQDTDSLDTWFSSSLWTFSTLGWPDNTSDLDIYHPTTFMNPGYEIIFFWVARMVMMSNYLLNMIPFQTVYLHGMVRDKSGVKFSKSLKNGVEPEEIIQKFGADALRMATITDVGPGNDLNFSEDKVRAYKKFANKIWNASRFVLEQTTQEDIEKAGVQPTLTPEDQAHIEEFDSLLSEITQEMEEYKLYLVTEKLYHYFWHTFADTIIEKCKARLQNPISPEDTASAKYLLRHLLITQLKALHPFMPFITEEIWQKIHKDNTMIMVQPWPSQK